MQIIQKIATWAAGQPAWVDDAIRRLISGPLAQSDFRELADLAKSEHGLPNPLDRTAVRLDPVTLPATSNDGVNVNLCAFRNPENLNAIATNQTLTFHPQGLTVVYGHNGAGKSGYARALKKACRARNVENILPDVYNDSRESLSVSATLEWHEENNLVSHAWAAHAAPPPRLSQISVFDSHCARVFVDNQSKVLFVPNGMDVIHGLSDALGHVQRILEADRKTNHFDHTLLHTLAGTTAVGAAHSKLGRNSDPEKFRRLAELSAEEEAERATLVKLLRDKDPTKLAAAIRRNVARLRTLRAEFAALEAPLRDEALGKLSTSFVSMTAAEAASKMAAEMLRAGGCHVLGTGSEPWEHLLRSATKFATEVAYPGQPFPGPDEAHCVLCQQPLNDDASRRLKSFVQFLDADAQRKAGEARELTKSLYRTVTTLDFEGFPSDRVLLEELQDHQPALAAVIHEYTAALVARRVSVMSTAANRKVYPQDALPSSPVLELDKIIEKQLAEAVKLETVLIPEEREGKHKALLEFEARLKLAQLLPKVLEAIEWHKCDHAYGEAIKGCTTRSVTAIATALYEAHVTEELRAAFAQELANLGLRKLNVGLEMTGQKGARMQQLKLRTMPQYARAKTSDILSEGEQRVIAMALFLAEVGIEPGRSGLIFDDPVSSLDHVRRERIAKRLVMEAKSRQIIVFTHDLAFAWALKDFAEDHAVTMASRHIFAAGSRKGFCNDGLPFEAKTLSARVNDLREQAKRATTALEEKGDHDLYNEIVRNGYRKMRDTWELLIEDHLFAGAVKRFRRSIETMKLRYVSVSDEEASVVYNGMSRCSNFTHEGGAEAPPPLPSPDEFLVDVEELAAALKLIDNNKKLTEKRRQSQGLAAAA